MAAAPSWQVPPETLVTIEYPGVVQSGAASLERALSTLSPNVGPTDGMPSAASALKHLARVLSLGGKLVECRLAPTDGEEGDAMQIYRHPLLGDIVGGSELVVRIQRRIWRCTHADGRTEERKEYLVTLLGGVRATVRFRRMADFAFRPDVPSGAHEHPTLALHRALVEMDVGAMQRFRFPHETEEYEVLDTVHGKRMRSDLAMIPPPIFSRMELPFNYGYVVRLIQLSPESRVESADGLVRVDGQAVAAHRPEGAGRYRDVRAEPAHPHTVPQPLAVAEHGADRAQICRGRPCADRARGGARAGTPLGPAPRSSCRAAQGMPPG